MRRSLLGFVVAALLLCPFADRALADDYHKVVLHSPKGGEHWAADSTHAIRWEIGQFAAFNYALIEYTSTAARSGS